MLLTYINRKKTLIPRYFYDCAMIYKKLIPPFMSFCQSNCPDTSKIKSEEKIGIVVSKTTTNKKKHKIEIMGTFVFHFSS